MRRERLNQTKMITVIGISRGVGKRHFSIMLANYFTYVLGNNTAIVCVCERFYDDCVYADCGVEETCGSKIEKKLHRISGIDIYDNMGEKQVAEIMLKNYDWIILNYQRNSFKENVIFFRSYITIVVGSLSEWKIAAYEDFFNEYDDFKHSNRYIFLSLNGDKKAVKYMRKRHNINIHKIPCNDNPFCMKRDAMLWVHNLIGLV